MNVRIKQVLLAATLGLASATVSAGAIRDTALFVDHTLMPFDDNNSGSFASFPLNFLGTQAQSLSVNSNGVISHGNLWPINFNQLTQITPMLAPFFANVDNRHGGVIQWGFDELDGRRVLGAQWLEVRAYNNRPELTNSFQLIITERLDAGAGAFDFEFNYDHIGWDTSDATWWDPDRTPDVARVGWVNPQTGQAFEFEGSGVHGALLDTNQDTGLIHNSRNSGVMGRYVFEVRAGAVLPEAQDPPTSVPEPGSLALLLGGLAALGRVGRSARVTGARRTCAAR